MAALKFEKVLIANERYESAGIFDVNNNGHLDIVSGAYWYPGPDFDKMFLTGQIGMMMGASGAMRSIEKQASKFDWGIAPLPSYRQKITRLGTANYVVMAESPYPKKAWKLLKYLAGKDSQQLFMEHMGLMPAIEDLANSESFKSLFPRRNVEVVIKAVDYARPGCRFYYWSEVYRALKPAYDKIWISENPDIENLMKHAVETANKNIKK